MNALSSLGNHFLQQAASHWPAQLTDRGWQGHDLLQSPARSRGDDVALSEAGKALARQDGDDASSLLQRVSQFGSATIEAAQKFVSNFAQSLFGVAAGEISLSFDSTSISARSSISGSLQHSEDSSGSSDSGALRLEDASDFLGKGVITTADGRRFSFEVEVHYQSMLEVSASSHAATNAVTNAGPSPARPPVREGLAAHFPGAVADLFRILDQGALHLPFQWQANDANAAVPQSGSLTMRLLDLLASPDAIAGKLADAYGDLPPAGRVAAGVVA